VVNDMDIEKIINEMVKQKFASLFTSYIRQCFGNCVRCGKPIEGFGSKMDQFWFCDEPCIRYWLENYSSEYIKFKMKSLSYDILDVLMIGATGVGKSSTINALFRRNMTQVGHGVDPQTSKLDSFLLSNSIRVWDSPGLGDTAGYDTKYRKLLKDKLNTRIKNDELYGFVDIIVVVLEAGRKDLGTVISLLTEVVVPHLNDEKRIIIALNQADFVLNGNHFDYNSCMPSVELVSFLEEKAVSIQQRLKNATGLSLPVNYYSAETGYNLTKFLDCIIENIPSCKRYLG
jgi:uncharacterized protein